MGVCAVVLVTLAFLAVESFLAPRRFPLADIFNCTRNKKSSKFDFA